MRVNKCPFTVNLSRPAHEFSSSTIVTNGDQTDTIYDYLAQGKDMEAALETREFEPDPPNLTPRISGQLCLDDSGFRYKMSILKSMDAEGSQCTRQYFRYKAISGLGHFIHTYVTDGNPIPTFVGEPERIAMPDCLDEFTKDIWTNLDADNKISLYTSFVDLETGECHYRLLNKHYGD